MIVNHELNFFQKVTRIGEHPLENGPNQGHGEWGERRRDFFYTYYWCANEQAQATSRHNRQDCQNKHHRKYKIGISRNTSTAPRSRSWRSLLTDYSGNRRQADWSSRMSDSQTGKDDASTIAHYQPTFSSSKFSAHKGQLLVVWTASLN